MTWDKVAESVLGSGPLAICFAAGLVVLWKDNQAIRAALAAKEKEFNDFLRELLKNASD